MRSSETRYFRRMSSRIFAATFDAGTLYSPRVRAFLIFSTLSILTSGSSGVSGGSPGRDGTFARPRMGRAGDFLPAAMVVIPFAGVSQGNEASLLQIHSAGEATSDSTR